MSTDAIVMLKTDHKEIKRLFRRFEKAENAAEKQSLVNQILALLAVHTYIENKGLYPKVRKLVPDLETDILESYEEHHVADLLCAELVEMTPDDERFTAKTTVLIESVEHHIQEEESSWFPDVREALGRKDLREIGAKMVKLRKKASKQAKLQKTQQPDQGEGAGRPGTTADEGRKPTKVKVPAQAVAAVREAEAGSSLPGVKTVSRG